MVKVQWLVSGDHFEPPPPPLYSISPFDHHPPFPFSRQAAHGCGCQTHGCGCQISSAEWRYRAFELWLRTGKSEHPCTESLWTLPTVASSLNSPDSGALWTLLTVELFELSRQWSSLNSPDSGALWTLPTVELFELSWQSDSGALWTLLTVASSLNSPDSGALWTLLTVLASDTGLFSFFFFVGDFSKKSGKSFLKKRKAKNKSGIPPKSGRFTSLNKQRNYRSKWDALVVFYPWLVVKVKVSEALHRQKIQKM